MGPDNTDNFECTASGSFCLYPPVVVTSPRNDAYRMVSSLSAPDRGANSAGSHGVPNQFCIIGAYQGRALDSCRLHRLLMGARPCCCRSLPEGLRTGPSLASPIPPFILSGIFIQRYYMSLFSVLQSCSWFDTAAIVFTSF